MTDVFYCGFLFPEDNNFAFGRWEIIQTEANDAADVLNTAFSYIDKLVFVATDTEGHGAFNGVFAVSRTDSFHKMFFSVVI